LCGSKVLTPTEVHLTATSETCGSQVTLG